MGGEGRSLFDVGGKVAWIFALERSQIEKATIMTYTLSTGAGFHVSPYLSLRAAHASI
jgi:hypothetical protein